MGRLAIFLIFSCMLAGCAGVIGYEPTEAEAAAIARGEDPRANEQPRESNGGEATDPETGRVVKPKEPPKEQPAGPGEGTVLRWVDSATLVIEAGAKRETVALVGEAPREDGWEEQRLLDERMNKWTYGTAVKLKYPTRNEEGKPIYRDGQGRLLAVIE
ncbi:MAG: hypothetical protein IPK87_08970 [Planctomycetes bacterium]|nr:hypothetical protein [Planctomycetota bacterium]